MVTVASGTLVWALVGAVCWAALVYLIRGLLPVAAEADQAVAGIVAEPPVVRAMSERWGRLALDVQGALGVERVAVVRHEEGAPRVGVIVACCGRPDLVGTRIRVDGGFGWGPGAESRFLVDPSEHWSVVSVPIAGPSRIAGTVAVATRRRRGISALEVGLLERITVRAAGADAAPTDAQRRIRGRQRYLA